MQNIFKNKYLDQKKLVKDHFYYLVSNFSELNQKQIDNLSINIVKNAQSYKSGSPFSKLIHEFSLTSNEGIVLMCLAEALLRIPDAKTINDLIEDKIPIGDWKKYIKNDKDLFVNISSIAFLLTGKIVQEKVEENKNILGKVVKNLSGPILRNAIKQAINILAKQFVFERDIKKAIDFSNEKKHDKYTFSFDMLGEAAVTYEDSDRYYKQYEQAIIETGKGKNPHKKSISIKLSSLHPRYERNKLDLLKKELFPKAYKLTELGRDNNVDICFDAEEADRLNLSLFIFKEIIESKLIDEKYQGFGFAVQAYQKRAFFVLDWLKKYLNEVNKKINIRLVKGAYWDTEIKIAQEQGFTDYPVFTKKFATDISYLACAHKLYENDNIFSQFATHNAHSISYIKTLFKDRDFEFQKLHGMGDEIYSYLEKDDNFKCRVYAPVGGYKDLLPYLVRRLLENGANTSFIHQLKTKDFDILKLVQSPLTKIDKLDEDKIKKPIEIYGDRKNSKGLDLSEEDVVDSLKFNGKFKDIKAYSLINGEDIKSDEVIDIKSPHSSTTLGKKYFADEKISEAAIESLKEYSSKWKNFPIEKKVEIFLKFADLIEENTNDIIEICAKESGKSIKNSIAEIREAVDFCRYYSKEALNLFQTQTLKGPTGELNQYRMIGKGLSFVISPWNFPVAIFVGQTVAALITGNVVITKPAEQSSFAAYYIIKLLLKAGLPNNAIALLLGDGALIGKKVINDKKLKNVIFTGSLETAKIIQSTLQQKENIPTFVAETGGLNCMIVDTSALTEHVVKDVVNSGFDSAGQRCSACRILCVEENVYDHTKHTLIGAMKTQQVGNPEELSTDIGPVIDTVAFENINNHIKKFDKVFQIDINLNQGNFIPPTLIEIEKLSDLKNEVFGPVVHMLKYKASNLDQLIEDINDLGFGLTLGIHSRIDKTIDRIVEKAEIGNIYINRNMIGAVVGVQPFGGYEKSGTGPKAGGPEYLKRLCHEQSISNNTASMGGNASLLSEVED
ncbi:bifunctional proline dehydrogenase/L-glutamate gamma-semialdehyde dehydrogenase PutA [Candidatus Pelagibacter sp.]|nr:bifunctional proline dehydrogenase/L-glutamate gamma-semialdehyde dehydrogenase PutA [Candidatus Pelagibacter sp.]